MNTSGYQIEQSELEFIKDFAASFGGKVTAEGESPWMDTLPIDFALGEEPMQAFVARCGMQRHEENGASVFVSRDPATGFSFKFTAKVYEDFPVCEWHLSFENDGNSSSLPLGEVKSLALKVPSFGQGVPRLLRGRGSYNTGPDPDSYKESFMPVPDELRSATPIIFGARAGRASDPWLPFFNYSLPDDNGGLVFAIGWPSQWSASVSSNAIQAGIERIYARLLPGEKISLPSIYIIKYDGNDILRGNNILRRFIRERIAPRYDGEPIQLPVGNATWGGMKETEHFERIKKIREKKLPFDVYWIDAGWYAPASHSEHDPALLWYKGVGNWSFHPTTFPNGVKRVADTAKESGVSMLLWFEPERAIEGTELPSAHPGWFLGKDMKEGKQGESLLLNLGNEEARQWCEQYISKTIEEQGLDWYREDFNIDPLPYWQSNDAPEREGITEIKAADGLYKFWGHLRERFPQLRIDNCASGGRRMEIELLRHSVSLCASDMQCFPGFDPLYAQTHVSGLSLWLPMFAWGTQNQAGGDTYNFRSNMAAGIITVMFYSRCWPISENYPFDWLRARLEEFHAVKDCITGDFYPLWGIEGICQSEKTWSLSQFDRPDLGRGALFAFARKESSMTSVCVCLKNLEPDQSYEIHDFDTGSTWCMRGEQLMREGIFVEMPQPRSSKLFGYQKK